MWQAAGRCGAALALEDVNLYRRSPLRRAYRDPRVRWRSNGEKFPAYIEEALVPTLRSGGVVILDNLRSHQVAGVREATEAVGASLIFIPYSPDSNPIELAFAKLKALLRALPRTVDALWNALGSLVDHFTPGNVPTFSATTIISSHNENPLDPVRHAAIPQARIRSAVSSLSVLARRGSRKTRGPRRHLLGRRG